MISDQARENPAVAALLKFDEQAVSGASLSVGEYSIEIQPERIADVCRFLKYEQSFVRLSGLTAVDRYPAEPRFEVIYLLHSLQRNQRIRLKCLLSGDHPELPSVYSVWRGADWYERETFDLFGIVFRGHPNLTRLMMPEGWEGHPLRKDYPIHGHRYSYVDE